MDKEVKIRIVRSDNKEFNIDGNDWKITKLEGFGEFENDINIVDKAVGDGGIITSSRIGTKDRTITAKSLNKYLYSFQLLLVQTLWSEEVIHKQMYTLDSIYFFT